MNTTVADTRRQAITEIRSQLDAMMSQFAAVLPPQIPAQRFVRVVITGIQNNPELLECDRRSLFNASMRAATDGGVPDGREGALVVFKTKRGKEVGWLPMIALYRKKVFQSGEVITWETGVVHERDYWEFERGDIPRIVHREVRGDRGPVIAAYSIATFKTGEKSREWVWIEDIEKIRAKARAQNIWDEWFDEMCRKTAARRHFKMLPTSNDLERLIEHDDELYELDRADRPDRDQAAQLPPRTLTDALNKIAAPGGPHAPETLDTMVDGETGEVLEPEPARAGSSA
jgi:recombination protein RecT